MNKKKETYKEAYTRLIEPSIQEARMRRQKEVHVHHFEMDPKYFNVGAGKTYLLKTYGCQGNLADSEKIAGLLEMMGFEATTEEVNANLILFNTCAIRENAEERFFGELGRLQQYKKKNPNMIVGVCGCMPQEEKIIQALKKKYSQVDVVFGTHNIASLPAYLYDAFVESKKTIEVLSVEGDIDEGLPVKRDQPKKAWVNIMYGCDEFCTYCIVPYTRGKERSRRPDAILEEVKELIQEGYIEVTLLGQNVNAYGKDFVDIVYTFADLLKDLHQLPIQRIRFTTSHPRDLDDATIDAMALGGNIMPHLHLPVQSGSNTILKKMNRKYTKEEYMDKIQKLKAKIPGISITTDIIVAFPGETDEDFEATMQLVQEVEYEGAFTFIYSPREGTPAARFPNPLTETEKHKRLEKLNACVNAYSLKGHQRFEGKVVEVLVEGISKNNNQMLMGYTKHNMLVNFEAPISKIGQLVEVEVEKAYSWHLFGKMIEK